MVNKIVVHSTGGKLLKSLKCCKCDYFIGNGIFTKDGKVYSQRQKSKDSIDITLIGRFNNVGRIPTESQWKSLVKLVSEECEKYEIPVSEVYGHRELDKEKECPGLSHVVDLGRLFIDIREIVGVKDEDIVKNNLRMMTRNGMGCMPRAFSEFTFRGDFARIYFFYDKSTGEMRYFSKWETASEYTKSAYHYSGYINFRYDKRFQSKIEIIAETRADLAKKNFKETESTYNKMYGF